MRVSSPSGAGEAKEQALAELQQAGFDVAAGVLSYAAAAFKPTVAARVNFSFSGLVAGSANAICARMQDVIDVAVENLEFLADYGVTPAKINLLKQRLKAYDAVRGLPRQAKAASAAATVQLERLFPRTERLLDKRIDRLAWKLREPSPEFYEKYLVARTVVEAPTRSDDEESGAAAPAATAKETSKAASGTASSPGATTEPETKATPASKATPDTKVA